MKLHLDAPRGTYLIRSYAPGQLLVGETTLHTSTIVSATTLTAWRPATIDDLTAADLEPLYTLAPEVVLLGTGAQQRFPAAPLLRRAVLAAHRRRSHGHAGRVSHL